MPHRRHSIRRKRQNRRRKTRHQRGGSLPRLRSGAIRWPANEGCAGQPTRIEFQVGELFDRFGPETGTYTSPVGIAADRIASILGITEDQPNIYSYSSRALPYAGVSNSGVEGNALRADKYTSTYTQNLQGEQGTTDYHTYEVLKPGIGGAACLAAPAFNTPGNAIQVNLERSVADLLAQGMIKERPVDVIPGYFPSSAPIYQKIDTGAFRV